MRKYLLSCKCKMCTVLFFCLYFATTAFSQQQDDIIELNNQIATLYQQAKYKEAISFAQRVYQICEQKFGQDHPNTATSLNNLAQLYCNLGDYSRAEPLYKQALRVIVKCCV